MIQQLVLFMFLLSISFLQVSYPQRETLQPITVQNAGALQPLAAIGSDTPGDVVWSPDGKILAAVSSGQVVLYNSDDLKAVLTIPHRFDEAVSFDADGQLNVGDAVWDIQKGIAKARSDVFDEHSPSGRLEFTAENDGKPTVVNIKDSRGKVTPLMTGTNGKLQKAIFSPDEQLVVLQFSSDPSVEYGFETAQFWNVREGTLITPLKTMWVGIDVITFIANGRLLVTISADHDVEGDIYTDLGIWDGHTGILLERKQITSYFPVRFSPNKQLMVYSVAGGMSLWSDHEIGTLRYRYQSPTSDSMEDAALEKPLFSPDGKSLLARNDHQVMVWDTNVARQLGKPRLILENERYVTDFFFSAKGTQLLVLTNDNRLRIWDFTKRNPTVMKIIDNLSRVELSPDSKWIWAFSSLNNDRVLINTSTGKMISFSATAHIDPQWKYVANWSQNTVSLFDIGQDKSSTLYPISEYLGKAAYQAVQGGQITFTMWNGIKVYDASTGELAFYKNDQEAMDQYTVSVNGKLLLSVHNGNGITAHIRETNQLDGQLLELYVQDGNSKFFLLPDEKTLGYVTDYSTVYGDNVDYATYSRFELWNIETGRQQAEQALEGNVQAFAFSKASHLLAFGSIDGFRSGSLYLTDLDDLQAPLRKFKLPVYDNPVFDQLTFSPNDSELAATVDNQSYGDGPTQHGYLTMIFNVKQLREQPNFQAKDAFIIQGVRSPLFSPDDRLLLVTTQVYDLYDPDKTVSELWSLDKQVKLGSVNGDGTAAFSPDGTLLAVHDKTYTQIYSVAELVKGNVISLLLIPDNEGQIKNLAFSADGKALYLVEAARVRVYGVP